MGLLRLEERSRGKRRETTDLTGGREAQIILMLTSMSDQVAVSTLCPGGDASVKTSQRARRSERGT